MTNLIHFNKFNTSPLSDLRPASIIQFRVQERNLATEPSLWPGQSYGTVFLQQFVTQTLLASPSANSKLTFFLCVSTMFDFDFCNALPVRARVGSGTITAIYYYMQSFKPAVHGQTYYFIHSFIIRLIHTCSAVGDWCKCDAQRSDSDQKIRRHLPRLRRLQTRLPTVRQKVTTYSFSSYFGISSKIVYFTVKYCRNFLKIINNQFGRKLHKFIKNTTFI